MRITSLLIPVMFAANLAGFGLVSWPNAGAQESTPPAQSGGVSPSPAARTGPADHSTSPVTLPRTEQFDLRSKAGLEYRIFVAGPTGEVPTSGSPVIYLSDGNSNFPVLLNAARRLSRGAQPAVVVGIGYPSEDGAVHRERRTVDLTSGTSAESANPRQRASLTLQSAGNDQFLAFIEDELKPVIEQKHKIDRGRQTLFGHSFGGLFVLHVLFNKPEAFQTYLASSPSIWWNDASILTEEKAFAKRYANQEVKARVLISVGEWEQKASSHIPKDRADVLKQRQMVGSAKDLTTRLVATQIKGLSVAFREFAEEEHGSVVLPAASRGIRFALEER
ncbi:alpha/beta hydrolase-fold protein [Singulisphaera sp. Ch08]|uniref:Alpha/beta hydrolase-fold protein n=1 Tax=Singulisphaera sp. Ch08 TaxID=3120278 RepID=A0AAU7CBP6_9BACT